MVFKQRYPRVEPDPKYGQLASNFFWHQLDRFAAKTLFVDFETGRQWRGAQVKETCARIAQNLLQLGLERHSNSVLFYKHNDHTQLVALGLLFAGSSVCAGFEGDPEPEHAHMLQLLKPALLFVRHTLLAEAVRHCANIAGFKPRAIVIMDDDELAKDKLEQLLDGDGARQLARLSAGTRILGLHGHLLTAPSRDARASLPVQVEPDWPAFILLTSGSTGRPKPAGRSQRNSLYVAHSLGGGAARELWDLNESSVVAGHLALDHGTGIFQLKQNLAQGFTCVLMDGYRLDWLLAAIERHRITDVVLGSALVHKFLTAPQVRERLSSGLFASLRNLLAVGSSIASQAAVREFMARVPNCSVRQAFGMTECGFLSVVPRELASARGQPEDSRVVGYALPNVEFKLLEFARTTCGADEQSRAVIEEPERQGELYVRGPTVSPGYHGPEYRDQSRELFRPDGFYKSGDICSFTPEGMLRIHGRQSEVLCLYDGWKVLPVEIEQVLLEHPPVGEAAVLGVPHPDLPTCHAPRAYVVPREGAAVDESDDPGPASGMRNGHAPCESNPKNDIAARDAQSGHGASGETSATAAPTRPTLTKRELFDFIAGRLSEPKHLVGGIRFMRELPKISIGKVDKKSLRKMEGLA